VIRPAVLLAAVGSLIFLWHECGQDAGVFCYRIGWDAVTGLRERGLARIPLRASFSFSGARNRSECLKPSANSSMRFLIPTDFES
jgi:hypothetical protein